MVALGIARQFPPAVPLPMENPGACTVRRIVILMTDRIYAESLGELARRPFRLAQVDIATSVDDAAARLARGPADLLVTGIGFDIAGDVPGLLAHYLQPPHAGRPVLVLSSRQDYRELAMVRTLGINGFFDSLAESTAQLPHAMETVAAGGRYCSPTLVRRMQEHGQLTDPMTRILTTFEQLALAVIGDGSDDQAAARELGVSPATVSTVRRDIHRKLGVKHRGELMRIAAQHGFVRFTPTGVLRPGFSILCNAYRSKKNTRSACATPVPVERSRFAARTRVGPPVLVAV